MKVRLSCFLIIWYLTLCNARAQEGTVVEAVTRGDRESVLKCIQKGRDIESSDSQGNTGLIAAILTRRPDLAFLLVENGAKVNASNGRGLSALMSTILTGDVETASLLLARGANPDRRENNKGKTALIMAIERAETSMVRLLLRYGVDVNLDDRFSERPPLLAATIRGAYSIMASLLEKGADVNGSERGGLTPLMVAAGYGDIRSVRLLLSHGADPNSQTSSYQLNLRDGRGKLFSYEPMRFGLTALMHAVMSRHPGVVQELIAAGANTHSHDSDYLTALNYASSTEDGLISSMLNAVDSGKPLQTIPGTCPDSACRDDYPISDTLTYRYASSLAVGGVGFAVVRVCSVLNPSGTHVVYTAADVLNLTIAGEALREVRTAQMIGTFNSKPKGACFDVCVNVLPLEDH